MEKDSWKDEIVTSLEGIQRAKPNPFLFTRIEARIEESKPQIVHFSSLRWAAVGLAVLLMINTWAILSFKSAGASTSGNQSSYSLSYFQSY